MDQSLAKFHGQLVKNAQILFKLSLGFSATLPKLGYLSSFASYRHTAHADELKLTREEEGVGSTLLEHVATYTLAVQIDTALGALYPTRFESADQMLRSAAWIARLVRNSFAHNPFAPKWKTYSECENKQFSVGSLISLDTTGLNGKYVDRGHYGGPLALLKLSEFIQERLERDSPTQSAFVERP
jgi:hypothetical protein